LDPTLGRHEYALKSIIVDRVSDIFLEELRNDISILRTLDHPNIVRLHEVYSYKKQIYLIMDLCVGGDLYSRVPYSERQAARYMAQLVSAVCYMHEHGVVHRDLKWENIMHDGPSSIKVIDFGLSKKFESAPMHMRDRVGTLYSMSPQALQGVYSEKTDLWSVGVISYMMLGNQKPFYSRSRRQMVDHIMRATFSFSGQIWDTVSNEGKDFVSKLLVIDPKIRMDALSALKHDWLVKSEAWHEEKPTEALLKKVDGSLYAYKYVSELKKVALNIIAHKSSSNQLDELRRAFQSFDKNRNGTVTFEEFKLALERSTLSEDMLKEVFDSVVSRRHYPNCNRKYFCV
jgi:calcium-dependent protein kinase